MKKYVEIGGIDWEAAYPFCAGCPELVIGGGCLYQGNGCRFPEERSRRPVDFRKAFFKLADRIGETYTKICDELGHCWDIA